MFRRNARTFRSVQFHPQLDLGQSNPEVRDPPRELTPETDDDSGTLESEHREPPENL